MIELSGAKPYNTHMQHHLKLHKEFGAPLSDRTAYMRLIGRLLYLTYSRPAISYDVSKLIQFLSSPIDEHMLVGLHVLKYIKGSPGNSLLFSSPTWLKLKGFSNSDWGAWLDTRRSIIGFYNYLSLLIIDHFLPVGSKEQVADIMTKSLHI